VKLKYTEHQSKLKIQSFKIKNNEDEFIFFSSHKTLNDNSGKFDLTDLSNDYYAISGNQSDFSSCNRLREFKNEVIFTVDHDQDKFIPEINSIGKNKEKDKFFLNCSLHHISDFIDGVIEFEKKGLIESWDKRQREVSKFSVQDNCLVFFISKIDNLKKHENNFSDLIKDLTDKKKLIKFKIKNGTYRVKTYYFDDIFGYDTNSPSEASGFNTLGHLIELEN
jgi:hypothetical protein